jgi:hypothetical protein
VKIQIWQEGWKATGQSEPAVFLGSYEAVNFDEAVKKYLEENPSRKESYNFNKETGYHSLWLCTLYDNEKDARKFNG